MAVSGTYRHEWLLEDLTDLRDRAKNATEADELETIMMRTQANVNAIYIREYIGKLFRWSQSKDYSFLEIQGAFVKMVEEDLLPQTAIGNNRWTSASIKS